MTFDEWYRKHWDLGINIEAIAKSAWNAAMEEFQRNPPEGLYRISEEVLANGKPGVVLVALNDNTHNCNPVSVRRKPAWMPKENEPVFVEVNGKATIGVWGTGYVHVGNDPGLRFSEVKPYNPAKIGKPWDEV